MQNWLISTGVYVMAIVAICYFNNKRTKQALKNREDLYIENLEVLKLAQETLYKNAAKNNKEMAELLQEHSNNVSTAYKNYEKAYKDCLDFLQANSKDFKDPRITKVQ